MASRNLVLFRRISRPGFPPGAFLTDRGPVVNQFSRAGSDFAEPVPRAVRILHLTATEVREPVETRTPVHGASVSTKQVRDAVLMTVGQRMHSGLEVHLHEVRLNLSLPCLSSFDRQS